MSKQRSKRYLALLLAFVMLIGIIPTNIFAAGELELAPAKVPTGVRDAAPPIESPVDNDSRNAVHAFVGVQTAGNLNDLIPDMTGQQFIPMAGIKAYFQWFEDGGYVSPIYTATSDANGRLNIGCKPYLAPDGKLIKFDADPTVSAGHEKYRFWVEEESIPEGYQLQYITGENVIFPKGIATITQGGSGSDTAKNTHENWKILLMQKPKAEMHRTDAKATSAKSKTGGNLDGKVSWDYNSPSGGIEWKFVAHHTEPAEGVTVRASYLSDYAMKQIYSDATAVKFGVSSADQIRGSKWTPKLEKDLQDWIKEEVKKDPNNWIAETATAKTNAEGEYIIQFNGTWGVYKNSDAGLKSYDYKVGDKAGGIAIGNKWTKEQIDRLGTVADSPDNGAFDTAKKNEIKHVNYDYLFVSTDGTDGIRVMTPYNNNYYTVMHEKYGISNGWSGTGTGVGVTNAVNCTLRADFIFGPGEIDFHITNYDNDANTAFPGDVAQTSTTGLPHSFTSDKYQIVWYGPDGKEVKRGTAQQPSGTGTIASAPFDTSGVTKTTEYTAKLHRVDSKGNLQDPIAIDSFTVEVSNYVGSRYDVFEHKNENPIKDAEYTAENLPEGLTIDAANGNISGKPKTAGLYDVKVTASMDDLDGQNVVGKITGSRTHKYLITDSPLADGTKGTEYNQKVVPTPQEGYVFKNVTAKFIDGKVIDGLTITKDEISGTPTAKVEATEDNPNVEVTYDIYKLNDKGEEVLIKKGHVDKVPLSIKDGEATTADKVKELGGLNPQTIKVWKGDKFDWKDGVTPKNIKNENEVWALIEEAEVTDITVPERNSNNAGKFEGKLKFTFKDGSSIVVPNQMLIVSDHIVTIDPKDPSVSDLPSDKIEVRFVASRGVKEIKTTGKTYVKPGTEFKDSDFPEVTVDTANGYKEPVTWSPTNNRIVDINKPGYMKAGNYFRFTASATLDDIIDRTGNEDKPTPKGYVRVTFTNGEGVNNIANNKVYDVKIGTKLPADKYPAVTAKDGYENPTWSTPAGTPITADNATITATATATTPDNTKDEVVPYLPTEDEPTTGSDGKDIPADYITVTFKSEDATKGTVKVGEKTGAEVKAKVKPGTNLAGKAEAVAKEGYGFTVWAPELGVAADKAEYTAKFIKSGDEVKANDPIPEGWFRVTVKQDATSIAKNTVTEKNYAVKPNDKLAADKFPSLDGKEATGYENPAWYVDGTKVDNPAEKAITAETTFIAKADQKAATQQTAKPVITAPKAGDKTITGTSEPNAKVVVELPDGTKINATADKDGNWTANVPAGKEPKENDVIKAVATVDGKTPSEEATAKTTAATPAEQTAKPVITTPKAGDKTITGTSEPNAKVVVELPDGTKVNATADKDGNWTANVPAGKEPKENDVVKAVATVDGKTPSEEATATVGPEDPTPEDKKTKVTGNVKPVDPTKDPQDTGIKVENPDNDTKVTAKDEDGKDIPVEIDKDGKVIVTPGTGVDGPITVTITDPDLPDGKKDITVPVNGHEAGRDDNGSGPIIPTPTPEPLPIPDYNLWWPIYFAPTKAEAKPAPVLEVHEAYIKGYPDGTVRPNGNITRSEVATIFARLTQKNTLAQFIAQYSDVKVNDWFADSVMKLSSKGILTGYPDGTFKPNRNITRAEFANIVSKYIKNPKAANETFVDVPMNHWAKNAIAMVKAEGWITGYPDGTFRPDAPITRAEAVSIVNRMFDRAADTNFVNVHAYEIKSFTDLNGSHWAYYEIMEAAHTHDYERLGVRNERWDRVFK